MLVPMSTTNTTNAEGNPNQSPENQLDLQRIRAELVDTGLYFAVEHTAQTGSTQHGFDAGRNRAR